VQVTLLKDALIAVIAKRQENADVFVWPEELWTVEYIHEETTELARVMQTMNAPDHARNSTDTSLTTDQRKHLEWGQLVMMVLTLAAQLGIDVDKALSMALDKIDAVSIRKRGTA
jgi:NTP pyrophosphatase (non-canonical NTP hydrolase)